MITLKKKRIRFERYRREIVRQNFYGRGLKRKNAMRPKKPMVKRIRRKIPLRVKLPDLEWGNLYGAAITSISLYEGISVLLDIEDNDDLMYIQKLVEDYGEGQTKKLTQKISNL